MSCFGGLVCFIIFMLDIPPSLFSSNSDERLSGGMVSDVYSGNFADRDLVAAARFVSNITPMDDGALNAITVV
jgi:hypothetical protein